MPLDTYRPSTLKAVSHDVVVTSSPNLVCDLLSPPILIDDIINDVVISREVGEGELYTRAKMPAAVTAHISQR